MAYTGPELLGADHALSGFDCGSGALNDWLVRRALRNQSSGTSRTWVVVEAETGQVVAFYASSTASILRASAPKKIGRNQPEEMPAILLARMAVDSRHQARGLGAALLKHFMLKAIEVAQSVGVRVLLIHAKDENAEEFLRALRIRGVTTGPARHDDAPHRSWLSLTGARRSGKAAAPRRAQPDCRARPPPLPSSVSLKSQPSTVLRFAGPWPPLAAAHFGARLLEPDNVLFTAEDVSPENGFSARSDRLASAGSSAAASAGGSGLSARQLCHVRPVQDVV